MQGTLAQNLMSMPAQGYLRTPPLPAGGLGGLGLLFARWAISQGISRLTLVDVTCNPAHGSAADLQSPDCTTEVVIVTSDVALAEDAAMRTLGRVDGVMHAAGVLRDALLLKQTASSFRDVLAGKVSRGPSKDSNESAAVPLPQYEQTSECTAVLDYRTY